MKNVNQVALKELWPIMEEQILAGKKVRFAPKGTSMLPLIRQGLDTVVLEKAPKKLNKYDLPLYLRDNGQFVLHRIVGFEGENYICCGDNQMDREYGIKHSQILAIATGMYRENEYIDFSDKKYISYSKRQVLKKRLQKPFFKFRVFGSKIKQKLKGALK